LKGRGYPPISISDYLTENLEGMGVWWSLEWDRRPTTTRSGSGSGLAVVAELIGCKGTLRRPRKCGRGSERGERALSVEWRRESV